jgi:hypothetical protein
MPLLEHTGVYLNYDRSATELLAESEVLTGVLSSGIQRHAVRLKVNRRFGVKCRLHFQARNRLPACFILVSCLAYSSTVKMKAQSTQEEAFVHKKEINMGKRKTNKRTEVKQDTVYTFRISNIHET